MYERHKTFLENIHSISMLYSDDPEEGMRQVRMLVTPAAKCANLFEIDHHRGSTQKKSADQEGRQVLDMRQQLYGDREIL